MENYRNFVEEVQSGEIELSEGICAVNNLLVTADVEDELTSEEIDYWASQLEKLNEMCAELWMQTQGYFLDGSGIYLQAKS